LYFVQLRIASIRSSSQGLRDAEARNLRIVAVDPTPLGLDEDVRMARPWHCGSPAGHAPCPGPSRCEGMLRLVAVQELDDNRLGIELLLDPRVGSSEVRLPAKPPAEELSNT
jgi:hypothetical protein